MKTKRMCLAFLTIFLLVNLSFLTLVLLDASKALDVPYAVGYAFLGTCMAEFIAVRLLQKRADYKEVNESSKLIQILAYACLIVAVLMIVIGGVLKCI